MPSPSGQLYPSEDASIDGGFEGSNGRSYLRSARCSFTSSITAINSSLRNPHILQPQLQAANILQPQLQAANILPILGRTDAAILNDNLIEDTAGTSCVPLVTTGVLTHFRALSPAFKVAGYSLLFSQGIAVSCCNDE